MNDKPTASELWGQAARLFMIAAIGYAITGIVGLLALTWLVADYMEWL